MIQVSGLSKTYGDPENASDYILRQIELNIPAGQFVCVLGPSGCGKTTLLNLIAGFFPPTSGEVRFSGKPVKQPGPERAVVFQDPTLFPWRTALGNVSFGLRRQGLDKQQSKAKALRFLQLTGMEQYARFFPHALSGGMRQRVAIARALALEPQILLMDEPFSALDANTRERLQDELLQVWQQLKVTVFYVTHSVSEAAYLADRVLVMSSSPNNIRADIPIEMKHPRQRSSVEIRKIKHHLRQQLNSLPCCIRPKETE